MHELEEDVPSSGVQSVLTANEKHGRRSTVNIRI